MASDTARLRAIISVAGEIAATRLDPAAIVELVRARAVELTGADAGEIELAGPAGAAGAAQEGPPGHAASEMAVPLRHRDATVGVLRVSAAAPGAFHPDDRETLNLLSGIVGAHLANAGELEAARRRGYEDPLTGLPGRRAFARALRGEVARASRYGLRLSLGVLAVDGLDNVDELHGADAREAVLTRVAEVLRGVRASDMGFRIADDRFAVLLPNTPYGSARTVVERAAAAVGGCGLPAGHVHVDAGVAEATSADPPALLTAAGQSVADARERRSGLRAA